MLRFLKVLYTATREVEFASLFCPQVTQDSSSKVRWPLPEKSRVACCQKVSKSKRCVTHTCGCMSRKLMSQFIEQIHRIITQSFTRMKGKYRVGVTAPHLVEQSTNPRLVVRLLFARTLNPESRGLSVQKRSYYTCLYDFSVFPSLPSLFFPHWSYENIEYMLYPQIFDT